jgi:hypothetical protein
MGNQEGTFFILALKLLSESSLEGNYAANRVVYGSKVGPWGPLQATEARAWGSKSGAKNIERYSIHVHVSCLQGDFNSSCSAHKFWAVPLIVQIIVLASNLPKSWFFDIQTMKSSFHPSQCPLEELSCSRIVRFIEGEF